MYACNTLLLQANPAMMANAKLALFYDWLAYNPEVDNIMNIGQGAIHTQSHCRGSCIVTVYKDGHLTQ